LQGDRVAGRPNGSQRHHQRQHQYLFDRAFSVAMAPEIAKTVNAATELAEAMIRQAMADNGWRRNSDPISLPDGRELATLRDAADYITTLPEAKPICRIDRVAMEALLVRAAARRCWRASGHDGVEPSCRAGAQSRSQRSPLGQTEAQEGPMTVLIYVDTRKPAGDPATLRSSQMPTPRKELSRRRGIRISGDWNRSRLNEFEKSLPVSSPQAPPEE
jgi:hypothetical protein